MAPGNCTPTEGLACEGWTFPSRNDRIIHKLKQEEDVNSTLTSHAFTRAIFSRAWLKDTHCSISLCASSQKEILTSLARHVPHVTRSSTHGTFTEHVDFLSLLLSSNWTPTATPLFGRFAKQSPPTSYQPNAPIGVSSEAT